MCGVGSQIDRDIVSRLENNSRSGEHGSDTTSLYIENTTTISVMITWTKNRRQRLSIMKQHDLHSLRRDSRTTESVLFTSVLGVSTISSDGSIPLLKKSKTIEIRLYT
jgi:hypothetical protein